MTQAQLLHEMTARLQKAGIPDAAFDAKQLLLSVLDLDATAFLLQRLNQVDQAETNAAFALVDRRIGGEPLQYLLGNWSFLNESFFVGPGVLIPRPETEELVLHCEHLLQTVKAPVIYDLCAGSGCIGLSLLKRMHDATLIAIECSDYAFPYLRKNAELLSLLNRVRMIQGDVLQGPTVFGALPKADLIVSNPPYIPTAEIASLQREVQREPLMALDGGADGLQFYRCFASLWAVALKENGCFAFECGEGQGAAIAGLFQPNDFSAEIKNDFNGFDRFVIVRRSRKDLL